ncbi:cytochrome b5 [Acaromyces ingoldii]|uniref:Cytochrome b5 n=1 Tax=Acaromyces ingoldii TaxID=215250 RepID=A0A316YXF9_9BASI|nr:cytochrome b5 [Acaromyces ingoldii]PWN93812.1 cytochrome b5 [Acaromyces ingoldii]
MRLEDERRDDSDDDGDDDDFFDATSADVDIDAPPAFPALNSAQRSSNAAPPAPSKGFTVSGPSVGSKAEGKDPSKSSSLREVLGVPASNLSRPTGGGSGGGLMVPPSTSSKTAPPGVGGASGARLGGGGSMLGVPKETGGGARRKVVLQPGCSPLDWARLKSSGDPSLRAYVMGMLRVKPSELKLHNKPDDAWSAFNGKVYNITPYLRFHPGGEKELMRCAGRDGTRLFMLTHSWVNIDSMIDACMVGILVSENT